MMLSSTLKQNKWSTKQRWIAQRNVMPFWLLLLLHFLDVQWRSYGRKFWWLWILALNIDFEYWLWIIAIAFYGHPMLSQPSLNTWNGKPIECFTNATTTETWYNIEATCEENPAKYCTHVICGKEQCSQCRCRQCQWRLSKATNRWYGHPSTSKKCSYGFVGGSSCWKRWNNLGRQ